MPVNKTFRTVAHPNETPALGKQVLAKRFMQRWQSSVWSFQSNRDLKRLHWIICWLWVKSDLKEKVYIQIQLDLKVLLFAFVPTFRSDATNLSALSSRLAPFGAPSTFASPVRQEAIYAPASGPPLLTSPSALCLRQQP